MLSGTFAVNQHLSNYIIMECPTVLQPLKRTTTVEVLEQLADSPDHIKAAACGSSFNTTYEFTFESSICVTTLLFWSGVG